MKQRNFGLIFLALFIVSLAGCGGGQGAPGSSGSDTGIVIQSDNLTVTSPDIDVIANTCASGSGTEQPLTRTDATLNVVATRLNPDTAMADPFPGQIEQCTITYLKGNENPGAPIIPQFTQYPNCQLIEGTNTCNITLMDIQSKIDFWNAIAGGTNMPSNVTVHYVAVVNCTYMNIFGDSGSFQTELDIYLADFATC
jgi:hypothetical protein